MNFNPFKENPLRCSGEFYNWKELALKPYNKFDVDPYTRVRIILTADNTISYKVAPSS